MFLDFGITEDLKNSLDSKVKLGNPIGNQTWISIGSIDAEAENTILWSPDVKNIFFFFKKRP